MISREKTTKEWHKKTKKRIFYLQVYNRPQDRSNRYSHSEATSQSDLTISLPYSRGMLTVTFYVKSDRRKYDYVNVTLAL